MPSVFKTSEHTCPFQVKMAAKHQTAAEIKSELQFLLPCDKLNNIDQTTKTIEHVKKDCVSHADCPESAGTLSNLTKCDAFCFNDFFGAIFDANKTGCQHSFIHALDLPMTSHLFFAGRLNQHGAQKQE